MCHEGGLDVEERGWAGHKRGRIPGANQERMTRICLVRLVNRWDAPKSGS